MFLYARAIELALKSFLEINGVGRQDLASHELGHDLIALYEESNEFNKTSALNMDDKDENILDLLNSIYKDKIIEYPNKNGDITGTLRGPCVDQVVELCRKIDLEKHSASWIGSNDSSSENRQ